MVKKDKYKQNSKINEKLEKYFQHILQLELTYLDLLKSTRSKVNISIEKPAKKLTGIHKWKNINELQPYNCPTL